MKKIFFLAVMVFVYSTLQCQTGKLLGRVRNTDGPAAGATVTITQLNFNAVADSAGQFSTDDIPYGKYMAEISAAGYDKKKLQFMLSQPVLKLNIYLPAQTTTIDEVVISGTMKAVSKMNSPIPVEVYAPAYFKKNPAPNIFESLQMVNGVQPQLNCNVCNTGDIHINGMEGPYTMILIDGMPIVSSLSTVYGLSGIPNSMIKRIEIVKGPASTLYGSEAVGGLINIITKDASSGEKIKADISSTSIGEINADISSAFNLKNKSSFLGINFFNYQQRRDVNKDNFTDVTLQKRISVFNKWAFTLPHGRKLSAAVRYIHENRWGGEIQWQPAFRGTDKLYGESIVTNRAEFISTAQFSKNLSADFSYNYHLQDSYYGTVKYYATQQVAFAQLRWTKNKGTHALLTGIPFRYTFYNDNTVASLAGKGRHSLLPGIFVQDEITLNNTMTLLAGMRYDYNSEHGNIFTPRLSIKFAPNANHTIRLSGGNGYRVVNLFTEDHAALTGARDVVITEALKPEKSWNGNINYSTIIRHSAGFIHLDISSFYTYFSNRIVGDFLTDANKIIYKNLRGHAVSKGITLNTDFNFTNGLKIIAGATWMDVYQAETNTDNKLIKTPQLFAPKISGTFAISYGLPKYGVAVDFTGRINGSMQLPVVENDFRPAASPLYSILNFQITKSWKGGFEIYAGVKNLLNFIPENPLLHPDDPFNKPGGKYFDGNGVARADTNPNKYEFDPSYNFAAVQGAKFFTGIRWQIKNK